MQYYASVLTTSYSTETVYFRRVTYFLSMCVNNPSVHSLVLGSSVPYKASLEMAWKQNQPEGYIKNNFHVMVELNFLLVDFKFLRSIRAAFQYQEYEYSLLGNATFNTLGSTTCATPSTPSKFSKAFSSVRQAEDLPLPLGPTIIKPWWIWEIWYSWRI